MFKKLKNNIHLTIMIILISCSIIGYFILSNNSYLSLDSYFNNVSVISIRDEFFKTMLTENIDKAHVQTENVKDHISEILIMEYGNEMDRLKYELDNPKPSYTVYELMAYIRGKFINTQDDSNDMFIATTKGILSDFSKDCAIEGKSTRTWDEEIDGVQDGDEPTSGHYNKELARKAVHDMTETNKVYTIWQYKEPRNKKIPKRDTIELDDLISLYNEYGDDGIESYEILVISKLYDDRDIFDTPDVDNIGVRKDNYKLFIVQGLNISDIFKNNSRGFILTLNEEGRAFNILYNYKQTFYLCSMIMVILILYILILYNNSRVQQNRNMQK